MATTIGFLGAGHLGSAIISGMLADGANGFSAKHIHATCKSAASAAYLKQAHGINAHTDNRKLVADSDYIILGVKPVQMKAVLDELADCNLDDKIIITLAAGIRIEHYRRILGDDAIIIRAMPNVAASRQASLTGIYSDDDLDPSEEDLINAVFTAIGETAWLDDETQIDGITALSGSGIAYFFRLMQAMLDAGERYGFERDELYDIITWTAVGAGTLALDNDHTPPEFDDYCQKIAVPGGTTEAALAVFDRAKLDTIVDDAMTAVAARSRAIADELTKDW
ncbi:pyrroline-5-carboxylate reductase [Cardiobacterium sp. Marseille-Q4385]|uniref:pyrroline-5-carboxylate reductase n=1 Tax=Cardiobacterium sp. Marseille-Q4385 TaxID=2866573 RepID=UPI001CE46404|nr:pyrroline-5-carboxylate reductase [Cardiobacterium sp. Marseille-Q4385]